MKKRLLITSIVMMLVVAVALSTATYAWFTSNARVDMGTMTLKAAVSDADALGIGWLGGEANTAITSELYDVLKPMAPESLTVGGNDATTSTVAFRNGTTKEEASQIVFNNDVTTVSYTLVSSLEDSATSPYYTKDSSNRVAKAGVTYYTHSGDVIPAEVTVGTTNVSALYVRNFAPLTYSKNINGSEVQAFYVKNLSKANIVPKITVYASFTASTVNVRTTDETFKKDKVYYASAESTTALTAVETVTDAESQVLAGASASGYYQRLDGNDLIRVAIFTKPQSTGTSGESNYTLLGVLGNAATTGTAVTANDFDKNEVYFTRVGEGTDASPYVYTQDKTVDAENFATKKAAGLYTCANTAAFGASSLFDVGDAVKDLDYYANVKTNLTLVENLGTEKQVDIVAIAWLDGTLLDDNHAGVMGQVALYFE